MPTDTDPFAAAGFAPVAAAGPSADPFAAAGFAPVPPSASSQPPMSQPIGVTEYGAPIFDNDRENAQVRDGAMRATEKAAEGATFGMFPLAAAGARSAITGAPYSDSLKDARDYTADTSAKYPEGALIAEGAGSVVPTVLGGAVGAPFVKAAQAVTRFAPWIAGVLGGSALGGANSAGHDIGSGNTDNLASDTATGAGVGAAIGGVSPLAGALLQSAPNMVRGGISAVKNIATGEGRDAVAGQVLREASGDFTNGVARSPVPGLDLRTSQVTGNPGIAALDRTMASEPGGLASTPGDIVQNGRTSNQTDALAKALVGSDARVEPAVLTNQAAATGTQAVTSADKALSDVETGLWSNPALKSVGRTSVGLNGPSIASGVTGDVAGFPASWRDAVTGPNNKLGSFMGEINELGPNSTIDDVNSIRSRLLGVARDVRSGANPDSVTAAAASKMADSLLARIGSDPAIVGGPSRFVPTSVVKENGVLPHITGKTVPAIPPNPDALNAYNAARDFSRQYHTATGFSEFDNILNPNASGNVQANPEQAFGKFFDMNGGTDAGLQRLQGVTDLLRTSGKDAEADALTGSAQNYAKAAILRQARAGNGVDATGQPAMNMATLNSTVNKSMPAISGTPMMAPIAGDVQAAGNAAELLNRPSALRGDSNSTTFEKLRNHDLVNAIIGQSGSSALGPLLAGMQQRSMDRMLCRGISVFPAGCWPAL